MPKEPFSGGRLKTAYFTALASSFATPIFGLLCVREWNSPEPWSSLNTFSLAFIVFQSTTAFEQALRFLRGANRSPETLREALGLTYDPALVQGTVLLGFCDYAALSEYAHWHFAPRLVAFPAQVAGLALAAISIVWLFWADAWLARHFASEVATGRIMTGGPYRFVRHPRYLAILCARFAIPLLLGSVIAWAVLPLWLFLLHRRIRIEEAHLRELFSVEYHTYSARTARLIPGIY
jgi:protein-S-isoprenylcysteine O-methyltransferase Ste14